MGDYFRARLRKRKHMWNSTRSYRTVSSNAETGWLEPRTSWLSVQRPAEIDRHYRTDLIKSRYVCVIIQEFSKAPFQFKNKLTFPKILKKKIFTSFLQYCGSKLGIFGFGKQIEPDSAKISRVNPDHNKQLNCLFQISSLIC